MKWRSPQSILSILMFSLALQCLYDRAEAREAVRYSEFNSSRQDKTFTLSLDDAVGLAVRENRNIKAAFLQRVSQKYDLYVSEGKFFPKAEIVLAGERGKENGLSTKSENYAVSTKLAIPTGASVSLSTARTQGFGGSSSSSIVFTQPLLKNGGIDANTASVRIAELDDQINRLNLKLTLSQTITQVIYAYRELLRAQEQLLIAQSALKRSKDQTEVTRSLITAGRLAQVEIIQNEAEVADREVAAEEAQNQIESARLTLTTLLAIEIRAPLVAIAQKEVVLQSLEFDNALDTTLLMQPDYLIAKLQIERSRINLAYEKNQQLWDLSFVAQRTRTAAGIVGFGSSDTGQSLNYKSTASYAGLQLTIPIGDRSIDQAAVQAAVQFKTDELRASETRQIIEQRLQDAARTVQTRWRQLELSKRSVELSNLKLDAEKEKLKAGRSSNFQVLFFENDLRNAQSAHLNTLISYLNAVTDMDERMGKTLERWNIPLTDATLP